MERSVLAKRLKEARLRAGMSQKALGVSAGIDEFSASARVNQYERGKHLPDPRTAERLAEALKVPAPFLYASDDELASWILAYVELPPSSRRTILGKARKRVG